MTLLLKQKHGRNFNERMAISAEEVDVTKNQIERLMQIDPALKALQNNAKGVPVFISALEYSFGVLNWGGSTN